MDDLIGRTFGSYTITDRIAEGGMAVVYRGYQASLNRYAAIKVLRGELAQNQEFVTRFHREALAVARLNHPNILHIYDTGVEHGVYYIAMDYAEGGTLKDRIRRGPIPVEQAVSIAAQLADALDYAHQQGLIHRDVKPSNVLLTREGRPLLTDFGIAHLLDQATQLTRTGTSIGTPEYMAPEQAQGLPPDGRIDIYALGVVLYEMLSGTVPFRADTPVATMYKHVHDTPLPLRQLSPNVPAWLEAAVGKALAKDPNRRFQRAGAFANALRQGSRAFRVRGEGQAAAKARPGTPPPVRRTPPPEPRPGTPPPARQATPSRGRRKTPVYLLVGAILLLCMIVSVGGGVFFFSSGNPSTDTGIVTEVVTSQIVTLVVSPESGDGRAAVPTGVPSPSRIPVATIAPPKSPTPIPTIVPPKSPTPSGVFVPSLDAYVTDLRFFEGGGEGVPYGEREYSHRFPQATTRRIWWELHFSYPETQETVIFEIEAVFYKPDGSEDGRYTDEFHFESGWSGSFHTSGWGWDEPGKWDPGRYSIELYIEGDLVASDTFDIVP